MSWWRASLRLLALAAGALATGAGEPQTPPAAVGPEDAEGFHRNGQELTRGLLSRAEVERVAVRLRGLLLEQGRHAFGGSEGKKEVRFTFAVHELDPAVAAFVGGRMGGLWRAAERLAGTRELCVLMDRGFSKDPNDPQTHWHRDDEAVGLHHQHPSLRTVHAWIPLTAMGRDMVTLQYLVGTHRRSFGWFETLLASLWGWEFAWFLTAPRVQDDALELGDVAWHDGWVLHSAGSNSASAVRDGLAVSFAYCEGPSDCNGAAAPVSAENPTCRVAESLFDEAWLAQHRRGESDYAKTLIQEPLAYRAGRFVWRSVVGGSAGVAVHGLFVSRCCTKRKVL